MKSKDIEKMVDAALLEGTIEAECVECGFTIQCEADATTAWCDNCNKIVKSETLCRNGVLSERRESWHIHRN